MVQNTLPICLKISEKPGLVVGGGEIAWRKTLWLIESGVRVHAVAPCFDSTLETMAKDRPEQLTLIRGAYTPRDLSAYLVAIAATDQAEVNQAVAGDAHRAGVPINVVDQPTLCSFYVPATVRRGDLCLAIGTGGACPPLASRIRRDLEDRYPDWYGRLVEALGHVRQWLLDESIDYGHRRFILDALCEPDFLATLKDLDQTELEMRLRQHSGELLLNKKKLQNGLDTEGEY